LPGAKFAAATALEAEIGKLKLDRKHPVVLICENGNDSRKAVAAVKTLGFAEVAALDGGIAAWKAAALPLVK